MRRCVKCDSYDIEPAWRCRTCGAVPLVHKTYVSFVDVAGNADDGFEGAFFERIAEAESGFWWFEARNALIVWAIGKWFPRSASMLEIGCGTGFVVSRIAQQFRAMQTSASEIFAEAMPIVSARSPSTAIYQFDARSIPFRSEFDVAGAFDVIEHIDDDVRALDEIRQALRPGGGLLVTVPQHPFLWTAADDFAHHKRRYTRRSLRVVLTKAGFEVVTIRSFVSLLMPALLLSRFMLGRGKPYDPQSEYRISPLANRILSAVMELERRFIRFGLALPFGGSLLAVARSAPLRTTRDRPLQRPAGSEV